MFDKLNKKYFRTIFFILFSFCIISVAIVIAIVNKSIRQDFSDLIKQNFDIKIANIERTFSVVEDTAKFFTENEKTIEALESGEFKNSLNLQIETLRNLNEVIEGAVLYTLDGKTYSTNNISTQVSLEDLKSIVDIPFTSIKNSYWFFRNTYIPISYSTQYGTKKGFLTSIIPIRNNNGVDLAYLLVDIDIDIVYRSFLSNESPLFENISTIINNEKDELIFNFSRSYENVEDKKNELNNQWVKYSDMSSVFSLENDDIIAKHPFNEKQKLLIIIPMNIDKQLSKNYLILAGITIALVIISLFVAMFVSSSIVNPLTKLKQKMDETDSLNQF